MPETERKSNSSSTDPRALWRKSFDFVVRFGILALALVAFVGTVALFATWIYDKFDDRVETWRWLTLGAGGVSIVLLVQFGWKLLLDLWGFRKTLSAPDFAVFRNGLIDLTKKHAAQLFAIAFALVVFEKDLHRRLDNLIKPLSEAAIEETVRRALSEQGYTDTRAILLDVLGRLGQRSDYYFARFPVSFDRARVNQQGVSHDETEVSTYQFIDGVTYDPVANGNLVNQLITALAPCGDPVGDADVVLRVEGYASSQPFVLDNGKQIVRSEELNVRAANQRRRSVENALDLAIRDGAAGRIVVQSEVPLFTTLLEMERAREFNDRPGAVKGAAPGEAPPQDFLTRAAHIKVLDTGRCAVN